MSKPTYEYLEAQVKQLEADNEKAMSVLKEANDAVLLAKSKFDALAAENAGLKAAKEIIRHLNANREEANFCGIDDCYIDDAVAAMITPETDAFLAEVLAQGVEMLNTQFKKCTGMLHADSVVSTAEHFAAQLRKGVQS